MDWQQVVIQDLEVVDEFETCLVRNEIIATRPGPRSGGLACGGTIGTPPNNSISPHIDEFTACNLSLDAGEVSDFTIKITQDELGTRRHGSKTLQNGATNIVCPGCRMLTIMTSSIAIDNSKGGIDPIT